MGNEIKSLMFLRSLITYIMQRFRRLARSQTRRLFFRLQMHGVGFVPCVRSRVLVLDFGNAEATAASLRVHVGSTDRCLAFPEVLTATGSTVRL